MSTYVMQPRVIRAVKLCSLICLSVFDKPFPGLHPFLGSVEPRLPAVFVRRSWKPPEKSQQFMWIRSLHIQEPPRHLYLQYLSHVCCGCWHLTSTTEACLSVVRRPTTSAEFWNLINFFVIIIIIMIMMMMMMMMMMIIIIIMLLSLKLCWLKSCASSKQLHRATVTLLANNIWKYWSARLCY